MRTGARVGRVVPAFAAVRRYSQGGVAPDVDLVRGQALGNLQARRSIPVLAVRSLILGHFRATSDSAPEGSAGIASRMRYSKWFSTYSTRIPST